MDSHAHPHTAAHSAPGTAGHHHVAGADIFLKVLVALLFLTALTVVSSRIPFGGANMLIAMFIASIKAALVISIFMHLKWDTAVNRIFFLGSFLFLSLLFTFTLADLATRSRDNSQRARIRPPVDNEWVHPGKAQGAR